MKVNETYQETQVREAREKQEIRVKIRQVEIAGWEWREPKQEDWKLGSLVNESGGVITFTQGQWKESDKIHIGVDFPKDRQGKSHSQWYNVAHPSINVANTKTATQIGKDIERRLIPDYLPLLDRCNTSIMGRHAYLDAKLTNARAISEAFPAMKIDNRIEGNDYHGHPHAGSDVSLTIYTDWGGYKGPHIDVKVGDCTVDISLDGLSVEQAKAVLAMFVKGAK